MTFSHVLGNILMLRVLFYCFIELLTKGVLSATQQEPYASIVLTRGNNF